MQGLHYCNRWAFLGRAAARALALGALLLTLPVSSYAGCNDSVTDVGNTGCIAADLMAADAQINQRYQDLKRTLPYARFVRIRNEQRQWIRKRDRTCELHIHVKTMDAWYRAVAADPLKAVCVTRLTQMRERVLAREAGPASSAAQQPSGAPAPTGRTASQVAYDRQYDVLSPNTHSHGKYYFEVDVNRADVVPAGGGVLYIGLRQGRLNSGVLLRLGHLKQDGTVVVGIAADLDEGLVYIRSHQGWYQGAPGSSAGTIVKLGRNWHAGYFGSLPLRGPMLAGTVHLNEGASDFHYAMPEGYKPFDQ